jgi:type IV secretory pathway VirB10-like protein
MKEQPAERARLGRDVFLATMLVIAGVAISGISLSQIRAHDRVQLAQAPTPSPSTTPAESMPGGTRPTTPAPEPAQPNANAQKDGAQPALPPAPAEKVAPPMKDK